MIKYVIIGVLAIITIGLPIIAIKYEAYHFNKGICRKCGKELEMFAIDSYGGRGYNCSCGYYTWVSYNTVDKNWRRR